MADDTTIKRKLGRRCRKLRRECELSQMDMVRDHGLSLSHYQKIERGDLDPRLTTLRRLARAFGVSVSEFLEGI